MKILYNPQSGSPIQNVYFDGIRRFSKLDNQEPFIPGQLLQFEDKEADFYLDTWGFLELVTPEQAADIIKKPKLELKCDHCDFATNTKIALLGHNRKHKDEQDKQKEPVIDPNLVPVVGGQKIASPLTPEVDGDGLALPDGLDKDGVAWYGGGLTEESPSLSKVPMGGHGHFVGGALDEG